jgi:hypothetical protein
MAVGEVTETSLVEGFYGGTNSCARSSDDF